jgi:uncharacterized protein YqfB (UPF0267 family)
MCIRDSYEREQRIGARVEVYRTEGERFVCPPEVVEDIAGEFRLLSADLGTQVQVGLIRFDGHSR